MLLLLADCDRHRNRCWCSKGGSCRLPNLRNNYWQWTSLAMPMYHYYYSSKAPRNCRTRFLLQANIVAGAALLVHATAKVGASRMHYLRGREWCMCVAPMLPGADDGRRRRFIAWHADAGLPLLRDLLLLLRGGFLALTETVQVSHSLFEVPGSERLRSAHVRLQFSPQAPRPCLLTT